MNYKLTILYTQFSKKIKTLEAIARKMILKQTFLFERQLCIYGVTHDYNHESYGANNYGVP